MTEIYDYTSVPRRGGILDISCGTKSKAVSGEKGSPPQDESGYGEMEIADYFRMLNSRFDKQEKISKERDSRFEALQEDLRKTNQRLEELQLRVPRPGLPDVGIEEGKPGELEGIATVAGEEELPRLNRSESSRCCHRNHRGCHYNRR